jgi:spermidine/putrescine transport system substrate-binding protein
MTNDPNEAIQFASFYLFQKRSKLNLSELNIVIDLLSLARKRTEAYASFRADYFLATKSVPLVITSSSYIWRSVKNYPFIRFAIPEEGSFVTIENICISKGSKNTQNAHALIDYLFSDDSAKRHFDTFGFFPSTIHQVQNTNLDANSQEIIQNRDELFKKLHFINELSSQERIQDAWVKIKVSSLP